MTSLEVPAVDPTAWVALDENFEGHIVEKLRIPEPPGGLWRWETYFVSPGVETGVTWYWLENVEVGEVGKPEVVDTWKVPLSHFACTQLSDTENIGKVACKLTIQAKSTTEQVSSTAWGIRAAGAGGTPEWVPLGEAKAGIELAARFKTAIQESTEKTFKDEAELIPDDGRTGYIFLMNEFQHHKTPVSLKGSLCQTTREQSKDCQGGWQEQVDVNSTKHAGIRAYRDQIPEAETKMRYEHVLPYTRSPAESNPSPMTDTFTVVYRQVNLVEDKGVVKVFTEGRLGGYQVEAEGSAEWTSIDSKGTEVVYEYSLTVTHAQQNYDPIVLWKAYSGYRMGGTVTEGPVFFPEVST